MKCPNCQKENKDNAAFCVYCGTALNQPSNIKQKKKRGLVKAGIIGLVAVLAVSAVFLYQYFVNNSYPALIAKAETYAGQYEYKEAENVLLEAINKEPANQEAYLKLSQIYLGDRNDEKAQEILEEGSKNQALSELNSYSYHLAPYYQLEGQELPENSIPVILAKGTVLYNDNLVQNSSNQQPVTLNDQWDLAQGEYIYSDENWKEIISVDNCYEIKTESETFKIEDGKQVPSALPEPESELIYLYQDKIEKTDETLALDKVMPVPKAKTAFNGELESWIQEQIESWVLAGPDHFISVSDYDFICSGSEGLFAAKKGDKWGYLNQEGEEVIPFELEPSWNLNGEELCYGFVHSAVPVKKDSQWAMINDQGDLIIPFGRFEEILPVDSSKHFYAKENGIWNHYRLGYPSITRQITSEDYEVLDVKLPDFIETPFYVNDGIYIYQTNSSSNSTENSDQSDFHAPVGSINYLGKVIKEPTTGADFEEYVTYGLEDNKDLDPDEHDNANVDACVGTDHYPSIRTSLITGAQCIATPQVSGYDGFEYRMATLSLEEKPIFWRDETEFYPMSQDLLNELPANPVYEVDLIQKSNDDSTYQVIDRYIYSEATNKYYKAYSKEKPRTFSMAGKENETTEIFPSYESFNYLYGDYICNFEDSFRYYPDGIGFSNVINTLFAADKDDGVVIINGTTGEETSEIFDDVLPLSKKLFLVEKDGELGLVNEDLALCWIDGVEKISAVFDNHAFAKIDGDWKLIEFNERLF